MVTSSPSVVVPTQHLPRLGDFEGRPLVHAFNPVPSDVAFGTSYFGLVESDVWPYGAVRTEQGKWYAYFRSVSGRATTGLVLMRQQDDEPLRPDMRAAEGYVGPVLRSSTAAADRYESEGPGPGPGFSLRAGDHVDWVEGSNLHLAGPIAGPGLQLLSAWREPDGSVAQLLHAHLGYEVHGEVLGERAAGYLGLAKAFLPYGLEWAVRGRRFGPASGLCALWAAFLNVYADGSSERGMFAHGGAANRFRLASVVRRDGLEFATDRLDVDYRLSRHHFFESIDFHVGNCQAWEFTARASDYLDSTGMQEDFSVEPPAGYHVALGTLRRVGDDRDAVVSIAWVEGFPEAWSLPNAAERGALLPEFDPSAVVPLLSEASR